MLHSHSVDLACHVFVGPASIVQGFSSFLQSFRSGSKRPVDSALETLLGQLDLCLGDLSEAVELLDTSVEDLFGLHSNEGTWEAEPESLRPKSPVSVKLSLIAWAPSIKMFFLRLF